MRQRKIQIPSKLTVATTYGILLQPKADGWDAGRALNPITLHGLLEIEPEGLPSIEEREFWDSVDKAATRMLGAPVRTVKDDVYYRVEIKEPND